MVSSAAAVLAVLPGVAVFRDGLYAPPGYEKIFGVIITVLGTLALMLLTLYRRRVASAQRGKIVRLCLGVGAAGLLCLTGFAYLRARAVCLGPNTSEVYVLIFPPAPVIAAGKQYDGICRAAIASPESIDNEVRDAPGLLLASNAIFLALYVVMNVAVVAALSIAAWRVAEDSEDELPKPRRTPEPGEGSHVPT